MGKAYGVRFWVEVWKDILNLECLRETTWRKELLLFGRGPAAMRFLTEKDDLLDSAGEQKSLCKSGD
jgi:hypothetical protein